MVFVEMNLFIHERYLLTVVSECIGDTLFASKNASLPCPQSDGRYEHRRLDYAERPSYRDFGADGGPAYIRTTACVPLSWLPGWPHAPTFPRTGVDASLFAKPLTCRVPRAPRSQTLNCPNVGGSGPIFTLFVFALPADRRCTSVSQSVGQKKSLSAFLLGLF